MMQYILYNTQTEKIEGKPYEGEFSSIYNSGLNETIGWLPEYILEIELIDSTVPEEYNPQLHNISSEKILDLTTKTYTTVYTLIDKTEEELIEDINNQAAQIEYTIRNEANNRLLQEKMESIYTAVESLPDEEALEVVHMFRPYRIGVDYNTDDKFQYNGELFKVLQSHTSALEWKPTEAVSLYVKITPPGTISEWVQPLGSHDAYHTGDKVIHNGDTWESSIDNNIWEPGVYGWTKL